MRQKNRGGKNGQIVRREEGLGRRSGNGKQLRLKEVAVLRRVACQKRKDSKTGKSTWPTGTPLKEDASKWWGGACTSQNYQKRGGSKTFSPRSWV